MLAVDERQSLETLKRDEKTTSRTLSQLKDKLEQLTQKRDKLSDEERTQIQKKAEVSALSMLLSPYAHLLSSWTRKWQSSLQNSNE